MFSSSLSRSVLVLRNRAELRFAQSFFLESFSQLKAQVCSLREKRKFPEDSFCVGRLTVKHLKMETQIFLICFGEKLS